MDLIEELHIDGNNKEALVKVEELKQKLTIRQKDELLFALNTGREICRELYERSQDEEEEVKGQDQQEIER